MADRTKISWSDATWNLFRGCSRTIAKDAKQSGCGDPSGGGCYAERLGYRFSGKGGAYEGLVRMTPNGARWTGKILVVDKHLFDPLRWKEPRRIFTTSVSDPFHENLSNESIAIMFGVMAVTQRHAHQCLTKRTARAREWFAWVAQAASDAGMSPAAFCFSLFQRYVLEKPDAFGDAEKAFVSKPSLVDEGMNAPWPLPNVWLGASIENQEAANERIPELLMCPAAIRWLSMEPLIGEVDLLFWLDPSGACCGSFESCPQPGDCPSNASWRHTQSFRVFDDEAGEEIDYPCDPTIDWIVLGCESGPRSRPAELDWYRSLIEQAGQHGVARFLKQAREEWEEEGIGVGCGEGSRQKGGNLIEQPTLDGVSYAEFPDERGPHDRPDCPCGHPWGEQGPCGGCNCADENPHEDFVVQEMPMSAWKLLPPAADACQVCATKHEPEQPHNAQSLYWQTKRHIEGQPPATWMEAMAHCAPEVQEHWKRKLTRLGQKLENADG